MIEKSGLNIKASDGFCLNVHIFEPLSPNKVFILINNATAIIQRYYHPYASFLCEQGYTCLTWDYRNTGTSIDHPNGKEGGLQEWGDYDLSGVLQYIDQHYQNYQLLLIAHSIGGVLPALNPSHRSIKGMIAIGVQSAYWKDWNWSDKIQLIISWHIILPLVTMMYGRFPGKKLGRSTDIPAKYIKQWSRRWRTADLSTQLAQSDVASYFSEISYPCIHVNATDDPIATPKAVDRFSHMIPRSSQRFINLSPSDYGPIGHFEFFKRRFKKNLWAESIIWLKELNSIS